MAPSVEVPLCLCPCQEYVAWLVNCHSACRCECEFWDLRLWSSKKSFQNGCSPITWNNADLQEIIYLLKITVWLSAVKIKHLIVFQHEKIEGIFCISSSMRKLWSCCYPGFRGCIWKWISSHTRQSSACCSYQRRLDVTQPQVWAKGERCFRRGALSSYQVFSAVLGIFSRDETFSITLLVAASRTVTSRRLVIKADALHELWDPLVHT